MKPVGHKNRACLEAVKKLRQFVKEEYRDGGWLPPGRQLAQQFGVSHLTFRKAIGHLVEERTAVSYPRKGFYIMSELRRPRKVGIVIREGGDSPLLSFLSAIGSFLAFMEKSGYMVHQIQASSVGGILQKALLRNVDALLWVRPPDEAKPVIASILQDKVLPVVLLTLTDPAGPDEVFDETNCNISIDYQQLGQKRADFFISRGHRRVAYMGPYFFAEYIGFGSRLRHAGINFSPDHCIEAIDTTPDRLLALLKEKGITGLSMEGGVARAELVMQAFSTLPEKKRPELLARYPGPRLLACCKKYPGVRLAGLEVDGSSQECGSAAARMMLKHLQANQPLTSLRVASPSLCLAPLSFLEEENQL